MIFYRTKKSMPKLKGVQVKGIPCDITRVLVVSKFFFAEPRIKSMAKLKGAQVKGLLCDITGVLVESRLLPLRIEVHYGL